MESLEPSLARTARGAGWGACEIKLKSKRDERYEPALKYEASVRYEGLILVGVGPLYRTPEEAIVRAQQFHLSKIWTQYLRKDSKWMRGIEDFLYRTVQSTNNDRHLEVGEDTAVNSFLQFFIPGRRQQEATPAQPANPTPPAQLVNPTTPAQMAIQPTPAQPANPTPPAQLVNPTTPAQMAIQPTPAQPANPTPPAQLVNPTTPAQMAIQPTPAQPANPTPPAQLANPTTSTTLVNPPITAQLANSTNQAQLVNKTKPSQTANLFDIVNQIKQGNQYQTASKNDQGAKPSTSGLVTSKATKRSMPSSKSYIQLSDVVAPASKSGRYFNPTQKVEILLKYGLVKQTSAATGRRRLRG